MKSMDVGKVTTYTLTGLQDGQICYIAVRAYNDSGESNYSKEVFGVPEPDDTTPPAHVSSFQATSGDSCVTLSWTNPTDDDFVGTIICYRTDGTYPTDHTDGTAVDNGNDGKFLNSPGSNDGFVHGGRQNGTSYYYSAFACDKVPNYSEAAHASASPIAPDTTDPTVTIIEAESITTTSPMQIVSDAEASGGAYIQTTQVDSGTAAYTFNIDESGTYKIIARVYALDGGSDSFYVKIDDGEEFIWHLNPSGNPDEFNVWREDEVNNQGTGTWDNPQYDPYNIELTQGTYIITFRGRETNCRLDYFYFSKIEELSYKWIQAESGNLSSPLETALDPDASAGAYIWKSSGSGDSATSDGAAEYTIDIPTTGDYVIWGRVVAPDGGSDSFFTSIDGGEDLAWGVETGSVWTWDSVNGNEQDPLVFNLAAGSHTLRISGREDGTKLDRLLITNDIAFVPSEENPDNVPPHAVRNLRIE